MGIVSRENWIKLSTKFYFVFFSFLNRKSKWICLTFFISQFVCNKTNQKTYANHTLYWWNECISSPLVVVVVCIKNHIHNGTRDIIVLMEMIGWISIFFWGFELNWFWHFFSFFLQNNKLKLLIVCIWLLLLISRYLLSLTPLSRKKKQPPSSPSYIQWKGKFDYFHP